MGKGGTTPWKCCKVFCALVVTAKRSVDQLFMHYYHNFRPLLGALHQSPTGDLPLHPADKLSSPDPLICSPMEKILRAPKGGTPIEELIDE